MLTVLGRQFHASQQLVRIRASRNANDVIERESTLGERIADTVARFGGSWTFIILFGVTLVVYSGLNVALGASAWDPYPLYSAEPVPVHARGHPGPGHHDEPESPGHEGPAAQRAGLRRESPRPKPRFKVWRASKLNLLTDKIGDVDDLLRESPGRNGPQAASRDGRVSTSHSLTYVSPSTRTRRQPSTSRAILSSHRSRIYRSQPFAFAPIAAAAAMCSRGSADASTSSQRPGHVIPLSRA